MLQALVFTLASADMTLDRSRFLHGLFFCCITLMFWGMLPIALKRSTGFIDPVTLTWLRFAFAGIVMLMWQARQGKLSEFRNLSGTHSVRLIVAGTMLIVNYTFMVWGLSYLHPGAAQLSFQLAPLFLTLGGWLFLKERVFWQHWACFALMAVGMLLFFHPALESSAGMTGLGFLIIQVSALGWTAYALLQKSLFRVLSPSNILLCIYLYALVVMLPFAHPASLLTLDAQDRWVALFCCVNTLVAYGSFAQAMRYWQTVQVSACIAMTPVVTFILTEVCVGYGFFSDVIFSAEADQLSLLGMGLVVLAAISVQLLSPALEKRRIKALHALVPLTDR
ncbi:DMT family transporter [uncultured Amphritea sp.]|uniref:DMT family transporter n=1 Tax=uncultured Amphritea sp. TaxID=981605 RepID=UPI0025F08C28|nr:DMT family transporter [uncultured Amphritea sp.]